ncbi:MAG: AAA family ATPase, partial [Anaerohalosphaera sp.]|nr:AAA family ATPase [Anaerohalosphaera sp.]
MIIAKIVNWANQELKAWEREAVKLFLTQNSISDKDKECLYHVLKKNLGLPYNNDLIKETDGVLKIEDICGTGEKNNKVVLRQIKDIKNVNAIPMDSSLSFANSGMTVIYGENGAGKSGYARILKKTCFARDEKEKIYGNIFASVTYVKPEAVITVDIDGEEKSYKWVDGGPKQKILGNICVFDRKSARIIVDEKNSVSYLPFGADVFQRLVDIIKEIKSKLDQEKPRLFKPEIADMPETTKAGAFFNSINAYTLKKDLVPWFQWDNSESNNSDEKRLAELTKKYLTAKDGDTTKQVQTLNNLKSRLKSFRKVLSNTAGLFSTESLDNFNQLIKAKHSFQIAYDIASTKPEGPLSGIATNEWEALYRAAKEYSIKYAYPNEDFPATTDDKKCVLCMQDLSLEASERLSRFHQFMENETKQSLENTTSKINEFI